MAQPFTDDPHCAAKRIILKRFLQRWVPTLGQGQKSITYVDGFAGSGSEEVRNKVIEGSPVIALEVIIGYINRVHDMRSRDRAEETEETHKLSQSALREVQMIIIEADSAYFQQLKTALRNVIDSSPIQTDVKFSDEPQGPITPITAACTQPSVPLGYPFCFEDWVLPNDSATVLLDCRNTKFQDVDISHFSNVFAFIDPFGFKDIPMAKVREILDQPRSDVLVNFMSGYINRFKGLKNENFKETLDNLFGSREWELYKPIAKSQQRQFLIDCYVKSLREIGGALYTVRFEIRGRTNAVIYHLIYATKHLKGLEAMKESMNGMTQDGSGEKLRFSDFVCRTQNQSFDWPHAKQQDDKGPVAGMILKQFRGLIVNVEDVHKFVVVETPFLFRKATLKYLLVEKKAIKRVWRTDGNDYRRATFPDECTEMEFLPCGKSWSAADYINELLSEASGRELTIKEIKDSLKGTPSCDENHRAILAELERNGGVWICNPDGHRRAGAFADHYCVKLAN